MKAPRVSGGAEATSRRVESKKILPQRKNRLNLDLGKLEQAAKALTAAGYEVQASPLPLLLNGCVLTAWHPKRRDGHLLDAADVNLVATHGHGILDPHNEGSSLPRWQRTGEPLRLKKYAEAVLARTVAEVVAAPEGVRNTTLNRAAFTLGRYLDWGLDKEVVEAELEQAASAAGLEYPEANSTITRGLRRGSEYPRDVAELPLTETLTRPKHISNHLRKLSARMRGG